MNFPIRHLRMSARSAVFNRMTDDSAYSTMRARERTKARQSNPMRHGQTIVDAVMVTIELVHRFGHQEDTKYPEVY